MKAMNKRNSVSCITTGALGLALIGLAACSSGDDTTATPASGGSAGNANALVFVNNRGDKTLTSVALKGDSDNKEVNTLSGVFGGSTIGDMQFSAGNWLFVNLGGANSVALIDPLSGATPIFEKNTQVGNRPVHIYRDQTDGEVIWTMMDGPAGSGVDDIEAVIPANVIPPSKTNSEIRVNCSTTNGGSVTIFHNSHIGSGGNVPDIIGKVCLLAKGHKVAAFSSGAGIPKRVFVSSEDAGEIAVIDNDEASSSYLKMTHRIDLCKTSKEMGLPTPATCNAEDPTGTTVFTPNNSAPHGIRWSNLTKKVYSIQENYKEIAEIDPATFAVTRTFDLAGTSYTGYGVSPDGRFLLLRGDTTPPTGTKLGVIDLNTAAGTRTDFDIDQLDGTSPGAFKFSPNGKRLYILAGNAAASTKKDRLFAFDASTLTATTPALTLIREIGLIAGGDSAGFNAAHSMDVLVQGAGEAKYIAVSNAADNSVSIINATDNLIKQTVTVGTDPGAVLVYQSGAAGAGNQASN
jgi:hypothetical protein